jgi:hypothetical protein
MSDDGREMQACGYAVQGATPSMLHIALNALRRTGTMPQVLPPCNGSTCDWVRSIAACLGRGTCRAAVLFCDDPELACCVANKVAGIRAAAVHSVGQAARALQFLGANLLVVEMAGRTFFEFKELLRLAGGRPPICPPGVACTLAELDGHAHR